MITEKFVVTKEMKRDIKKAETVVVGFNGKISMELITKEKKKGNWIKPEQKQIYDIAQSEYDNTEAVFSIQYAQEDSFGALKYTSRILLINSLSPIPTRSHSLTSFA